MRKFKLIVPSFIAIIFCMLLIAGSTFALFTSEDHADISVTSGKVQIEAEIDDETMELYSAQAVELAEYQAADEEDQAGQISTGNYAGNYLFAEQTGENPKFANGGTATLTDGSSLALEKMTPGDKVVAKLAIDNKSNVNIKYRVAMTTSYTFGAGASAVTYNQALASALKVTIGNTTKQGLVSYQSAWMELDNGADPESALDLVIEFPLEAGNDYQDGGVKYNFVVEAVQANAATSGAELFDTIDLYVPTRSAKETMEENTETVIAVKDNETDAQPRVEITIPAALATSEKEVELKVSELFVEKVESSSDSKVSMTIDLKLDGQAVTQDNPLSQDVTVKIFVGTGLNDVKLYHNDLPVDQDDYSYSDTTGYITYTTNHFSPFRIEGDFMAAVTIGNNAPVLFSTFEKAMTAANGADENLDVTVDLFKDVTTSSVTYITRSMKLNGNSHTITSSTGVNTSSKTICISKANAVVSISNLTTIELNDNSYGRGLQLEEPGIQLTLDGCEINALHYAINFWASGDEGCKNCVVTIRNSDINGWGSLNIWGQNLELNAYNSTFNGYNDKVYNSDGWNGFGTIVLEGDTTGATTEGASNCDLYFENCKVISVSTTGNSQSPVLYNPNSQNNSVEFKNCTFSYQSPNVLCTNSGTNNTLVINGTTVAIGLEAFEFDTTGLVIAQDGKTATGVITATIGTTHLEFDLSEATASAWSAGTDYIFEDVEIGNVSYDLDFDISPSYSTGWTLYITADLD